MSLRHLTVTDFRNLKHVNIELGDQLNVFFGANGSGKTSLLESINTLSLARSFRSRKFKSIINHEASAFTVFGRILGPGDSELSVGVQRAKSGEGAIRVNQKNLSSASELAELLPVRVINAVSYAILDGAPGERRALLDWLMFHVEHGFHSTWKRYEKCIKQRNSLLRRDKIDPLQLAPWDAELVPLALALDTYRRDGFERLNGEFKQLVSEIEGLPGELELRYSQGWEKSLDYASYLDQHIARDIELGYTRQGPHRGDIRVMVGKSLASEILSRGQQKMVVCALLLAQGRAFTKATQRRCVYLIDDLPAELDKHFRAKLCHWLDQLGCQVFVTGVEAQEVIEAWPGSQHSFAQGDGEGLSNLADGKREKYKVFHVEHGTVTVLSEQKEDQ